MAIIGSKQGANVNLKHVMRPFVPEFILAIRALQQSVKQFRERECPICGYRGNFGLFGRPPRIDARCRKCGSLERHRLFWLWFQGEEAKISEPILHFAPESTLEKKLRGMYEEYKTADLMAKAELRLNIEDIDIDTESIATVICNHLLEHVNDRKALREIYRILKPEGVLICSVPIIEGWDHTYENDRVNTDEERAIHFGQADHVRYYGKDFRERLRDGGFEKIEEITAEGEAVLNYGLLRGEKLFICKKMYS